MAGFRQPRSTPPSGSLPVELPGPMMSGGGTWHVFVCFLLLQQLEIRPMLDT